MDLARNLKSETVSRLYPTQAYLVQPMQPIADAVKLMRDKKVGCVLTEQGSQAILDQGKALKKVDHADRGVRPGSAWMGKRRCGSHQPADHEDPQPDQRTQDAG